MYKPQDKNVGFSARPGKIVLARRMRNVSLLAVAIILMNSGSARAQSTSSGSSSNYIPYALGSLLPRLGSSGGGIFPFASGYIPYAAPGYLPFGLRNMMYRPSNYRGNSFTSPSTQQSVGYANTNSFTTPKSMSQEPYTDQEPLLGPRQRTRPFRNQYQPTDQIAHAGWPNQNQSANQLQPDLGPRAMSQPAPPRVGSNHAPFSVPGSSGLAPGVSPNPNPSSNPHLADNFIKTVNSKFNGDISKALFDPQTRGVAKSVGLTDDDALFDANLSKSRVGIVRNIFNDPSLSSESKINAVKILLHDEAK